MFRIPTCGYDSHHTRPCNIEYLHGISDYLLLFIKKEAWMEVNGTKVPVHPNAVICYLPQTPIHYGCNLPGYNDDWIHFLPDSDEMEQISFLQPLSGQIIYPDNFHCLSEYVRQLSYSIHSGSPYCERISDYFLRIILLTLKESRIAPQTAPDFVRSKYFSAFCELRTGIYNDPSNAWNVKTLSEAMFLSTSYFQHLYREFFGCSCQQDIVDARIKLAQYYLKNSSMKIKDLSDYCGYGNELHFMRQFKKNVGITPTEYRNT